MHSLNYSGKKKLERKFFLFSFKEMHFLLYKYECQKVSIVFLLPLGFR